MTTPQKTLAGLVLAAAVGAAAYQVYKSNRTQENPVPAGQKPSAAANEDGAPQVRSLQAKNEALAASLAAAQAEKDKLAAERDAANRTAQIYKELADSRENAGITNKYPTQRHVTAAMGRMLRNAVLGQASLGDKKFEDLTPEERNAMKSASFSMMGEYAELAQASMKFSEGSNAATPANPADDKAVMLYGALDLNEQQFQQTYELFQRLQNEAASQNLLVEQLPAASAEALNALNQRGLKEFQQLLTPQQAEVFQQFGTNVPIVGTSASWASILR